MGARPANTTPHDTVRKAEELAGVSLSEKGLDTDDAANRRSALGAPVGIAAGLGTGALYGILRLRLGRLPLAVLGVVTGIVAKCRHHRADRRTGHQRPADWPADWWEPPQS